jgi:hypothetical protein
MININIDQATRQVAHAIDTYGAPVWLAKVPTTTRRLVPRDVMRDLVSRARLSEGWAYQDGCYFKGRIDSRAALLAWATNNVFAIMTVKEIAQAADVPESAVRSMIVDRPDVLRKSDGRTYEVRDANEDRRLGKVR